MDRVGVARYVTQELLKGYWQVPLTSRAFELSAFFTSDNFLQYMSYIMAFGMCNTPATFQCLMRRMLSGVPNCEAYLVDVVVYSADCQSHVETLATVF